MIKTVGVIGAGAWGSALAQSVAQTGKAVTLWSYDAQSVQHINETHENKLYLPNVFLNPNIIATTQYEEVCQADILLMVPPAQSLRTVAQNIKGFVRRDCPILICSKGIEQSTGRILSDILLETIPQAIPAILSGPSFAIDVANNLPTAVTLACEDEGLGYELVAAIGHKNFRPYYSHDMIGAQIGGAVKNVLAIAAGIVTGKQIGASAHAALTTRGFAELTRFGVFHKANKETLKGLSGLGDLILTCSSTQSRNMSLGKALGEGRSLEEILGSRHSISEGVFTAKAVVDIAQKNNIEMPICQAVNKIINKKASVDNAITELLNRPFKREDS